MAKSTGKRDLLFSVTAKDFDMQTFTVSGHGGGGKDTSNSGVRLIHRDSGARGEGRENRSVTLNRRSAFLKLVETDQFKRWHKTKCAELLAGKQKRRSIEEIVDEMMRPENLKIESYDGP